MRVGSSSLVVVRSRRMLLLGAVAAAAVVLGVEQTGVDVAGLCRDGYDGCAGAAGMAMTLSGGLGLTLIPGSVAGGFARWRRHPRLSRPLRRPGPTPVSGMQRFWPLLTAYWTSERWVEAWSLTASVFAITTLLSMSSVWIATASANFLSSLVSFHNPEDGADPVTLLITSAALFAAISLARHGITGVRNFASNTLHRKARRWTQAQFCAALLGRNHIAMTLESDRETGDARRLPDNIDERLDECTVAMYSGLIGLTIGVFGAVTSITFVSCAIIERSVAVPPLDAVFARVGSAIGGVFGEPVGAALTFSPGEYGSALLVALLIVVYVPLSTLCAALIGRVLQRQTLERQNREATWRGELKTMVNRASLIATSHGERVQQRTNARLYGNIDDVWHRMNVTQSVFMVFTDAYAFLSSRLVAYLPALPAYLAGTMSFRRYSATSELAAQVINDCSWFIQVMPAIVTMRAHVIRLNELACAIEAASDAERFYAETGVHDFRRITQDPRFGLTLRDLALHHRGHDAAPFLTVPRLTLRPGEWAFVRGANGCGKSSLLKAIAGLWAYGSGTVVLPEGGKVFFAGQDPDLADRLTLKELVAYPDFAEAHGDLAVAAVLEEVGLGKFIRHAGDALYHGKPWAAVFSGGQRQRLVLARILLQQPDVILLDEACAALDPAATLEFHRLLKERCGNAIVISVMHAPEPPQRPNGRPYYERILYVQDGIADLHRLPIGRALVPLAAE